MRPEALLPKLSPLVDVVFRRLFEHTELLLSLVNAILRMPPGEQLTELTLLPGQVVGPLVDDKEVVLDVRARTQRGRQFHVEVQVRSFAAYTERMLFYWAGAYHGQLEAGQGYRELEPLISIHILGFSLLPEDRHPGYHHVFELLERRTQHRLTDHLQMHTIELPKFLQAAAALSTDEEKWLYFLLYGHELTAEQVQHLGLPEIAVADKELRVISQDRSIRVLYEQRMKAQRDAIAWEKDKIAQWLDDGERVGLEKGKRALQLALLDICELLGIELTPERRVRLDQLDLVGLEELREQIKERRAWPG